MIVLFSHVRTGRWASVMPARLAETLGLTDTIRAIPIVEPEAGAIPSMPRGADAGTHAPAQCALVAEARRLAQTLNDLPPPDEMEYGLPEFGYRFSGVSLKPLPLRRPAMNFYYPLGHHRP